MSFILETNTLAVFDTLEQAQQQAEAFATLAGTRKGIRIRDGLTPVIWPQPGYDKSKVTHGLQGAETLLGKLVSRMTAAWGEAPTEASECLTVDEYTRVWGVDYKRLAEQVKTVYPGDKTKLAEFQVFVQETLAAEALRGISFK